MDLQNDQNFSQKVSKEAREDAQIDSSNGFTNSPVEPNTDDMELNEEQLDIISGGGGDGTNPFTKG